MQRRSFIKNASLSVFAVSASGFICFDGTKYTGDCETTTDILGPFYRPNAPVRTNLVVSGARGQKVVLSGTVKHKDCVTPLHEACVELWHCSAEGVYDNSSEKYLYRAKTFCDEKGNYEFHTVLPVPYGVGDGSTRPAHFHLLISAKGYQSLVTQLYFNGDKHISEDNWANSSQAKRRILEIKDGSNVEKSVRFDITMLEKLPADPASLDRLTGKYVGVTDKKWTAEFFKHNNELWVKDDLYGHNFEYAGDNTFRLSGSNTSVHFDIKANGEIQLTYSGGNASKQIVALKEK